MNVSGFFALLGKVAPVASVIVAGYALWRQLAHVRLQLMVQHFSDFARRRDDILERLPEATHDPARHLDDLGDAGRVMPAMRSFFALCFEEWSLHERGAFDPAMWELWRRGMRIALAKQSFREAWERIAADTDYGADFAGFVAAEAAAAIGPPDGRRPASSISADAVSRRGGP